MHEFNEFKNLCLIGCLDIFGIFSTIAFVLNWDFHTNVQSH